MATDRRLRAAAVVLVVAVVVALGLVTVVTVGTPEATPPATGYDEPGVMLPDSPDVAGEIPVPATNGTGTVVIDEAHDNRFTAEQVRPLKRALTSAGYEVVSLDAANAIERRLASASAFVVIDPGEAYSPSHARAVERFAESGGRVVVFGEPTRKEITFGVLGATVSTERSRLATLSSHLDVEFGTAYLYHLAANDGNFKHVFASAPDGDLANVALFTATNVAATDGERLLVTREGTRRSGSADSGRHAVAVRSGNVIAVGDASLLAAGNHVVGENEQFLGDVLSFLLSGERARDLASFPASLEADPIVAYTNTPLLSAAHEVREIARDANREPTIQFRGVTPGETDVVVTTYAYLAADDLGTGISVDVRGGGGIEGGGNGNGGNETGGSESASAGTNTTFATVAGHSVATNETSIVLADRGGYDLVVVVPDHVAASRATTVLERGELFRYTVTSDVALLPPEAGTDS